MISFDQLVEGLQIRLEPFAICDIRAGSGLELKPAPRASLHYMLEGKAIARRPGAPDIKLQRQDVLIIPPPLQMTIDCREDAAGDLPQPACRPIPGGWEWIEVGAGDAGVVMACAHLDAIHQGAVGLFDHAREPIFQAMNDEPAFNEPLSLLLDELAAPKPGTAAMAATLMKYCLIVLLRRYWQDDAPVEWLAAVREPQLGKAVAAMVERPEAPFTLEHLAEAAGMSRTTFAEQFKRAFGRPAMEFLKEVRLRSAAHLLAGSDLPIKAIASKVGFASRSHFTRAFKAFANVHPSEYREAHTS